ncbi:hypothetical protein NQZ68_015768 [Dissostichus eleginoides]|nr:hypothetical protein NQZ68_015768 [Dissostichus eleginoides]
MAMSVTSFALLFVFIRVLFASPAGVTEVKAKPGEDVTLHCNCPTDAAITLVQCKISGLEDNVFYFRDNKLMESLENPQFHGRVELKDPEMKNGDCSVVLKNISVIDTGTYTCLVLTERNEKFVASVHLSVSEDPGNETKAGNLKNGQINDGNEWGYLALICLCVERTEDSPPRLTVAPGTGGPVPPPRGREGAASTLSTAPGCGEVRVLLQGPRRVGPQARAGPRNGPSEGGRRGGVVGVVANEENIRQPQKAGLLCDVGTGVNIPVVPSREERCPAAGEGTAAAGTKPSGGRSGIPGRKEPWTGERPDGATSEAAVEANQVKAKPGEDVTLHCNCTTDAAIALAEWNRSGLENYVVLYFRDNKLIGTFHNPQFHGLLELKGDGSVVLKNVSVNDTGNYTCLVRTLSSENETKAGNLKNGPTNDGN